LGRSPFGDNVMVLADGAPGGTVVAEPSVRILAEQGSEFTRVSTQLSCYPVSLTLDEATPGAAVRVHNSEAGDGFTTVVCGSNTGTLGEPLPTRTMLDAYAKSSNIVRRREPRLHPLLASSTLMVANRTIWGTKLCPTSRKRQGCVLPSITQSHLALLLITP